MRLEIVLLAVLIGALPLMGSAHDGQTHSTEAEAANHSADVAQTDALFDVSGADYGTAIGVLVALAGIAVLTTMAVRRYRSEQ